MGRHLEAKCSASADEMRPRREYFYKALFFLSVVLDDELF